MILHQPAEDFIMNTDIATILAYAFNNFSEKDKMTIAFARGTLVGTLVEKMKSHGYKVVAIEDVPAATQWNALEALVEKTDHTVYTAAQLASAFDVLNRSDEHTSELQSLMRISYAALCLKKKTLCHLRK